MAKVEDKTQDHIETEAKQLSLALASKEGGVLLDTIETRLTGWVDVMLDPRSSDEQVLRARQKVLGVLEFITVWGTSRVVSDSIGRRELRRALRVEG